MYEILQNIKLALYEYPRVPTYLCLFVFVIGVVYAFFLDSNSVYIEHLQIYLRTQQQSDSLFFKTGLKINTNQYKLLLYSISIVVFLFEGLSAVSEGSITKLLTAGFIAVLIVYLFYPRIFLYKNVRSPFVIIINFLTNARNKELDYELYSSVTILKNLAIAQEENPLSSDLMIEKLMENSKKLKGIYQRVLTIYRTENPHKALQYFSDAIGTKNAKNFALILEKIDMINPTELKNQVTAFQETLSEEMFTRGLEKAEARGTVVYMLATLVSFICLLNFIFVSVLMDTLGTLGDIF